MPYFPVDDQFAFHPKATAAGNAALGVWVRAGAWCKAHATGGRIPFETAHVIGSKALCRKLVDVGLWHGIPGGYEFHDWEHQAGNFEAEVEKERRDRAREKNRERQARFRNAHNASDNGVINAPVTKSPSPSPIPIPSTQVKESSYVPDPPSYPQRTNDQPDVELGKVRAAVQRYCGRECTDPQAWLVIGAVMQRAKQTPKNKTAFVLKAIESDPFEFQQLIDEGVAA